MSQRVILVSGGNKGIGYEVIKNLSTQFPHDIIYMGTRDVNNGEQAIKQGATPANNNLSNVKVIQLDVTDDASLKAAVEKVDSEYGHLDILFNNSGIAVFDEKRESAESTMDVNVTGVARLNDAFQPLLSKSNANPSGKALIVLTGSECGAWFNSQSTDDNLKQLLLTPSQWNKDTLSTLVQDYLASFDESAKHRYSWKLENMPYSIYCISKSLATAYSRYYALQHPELDYAIVTPGYCATDLNGNSGPRKASVGAESLVWHVTNKFESGPLYRDGIILPHAFSPDEYLTSA